LVEEARALAVPTEATPISDASSTLPESQPFEAEAYQADSTLEESSHEHTRESGPATDFEPSAIEWSSGAEHQPAAWDEAPVEVNGVESRFAESSSTSEAPDAGSEPWTQTAVQESAWEEPAVDPQEPVAQIWHDLVSQAKPESVSSHEIESAVLAEVPSAWSVSGAQEAPKTAEDDLSPFAEFSIWKQGVAQEPASAIAAEVGDAAEPEATPPIWGDRSFGEAAEEMSTASDVPVATENPWSPPSANIDGEVVETPKPKVEPTSFIERYSHMFAEEAAGSISKPIEPVKPLFAAAPSSGPLGTGGFREEPKIAPAALTDDEESIEQYMAKLMQRVRGDAPAGTQVAASQAPQMPQAEPETKVAAPEPVIEVDVPADAKSGEESNDEEDAKEVAVNWEAIARRAAAAPKTNLTALRALANESARHAIGRHQLTKNRRDAKTKAIVATLAGMTSLWLMLDAPDWRDIQFITACGSLIAAAYWAGDAFRAIMGSWRVAAYEGPGPSVEAVKALPIDVVVEKE
jgi:hypothetical protein